MNELRRFDLVYLATPYTKYTAGLQCAFEDAARLAGEMVIRGVHVFSPIAHGHPISMYGGVQALNHPLWLTYDKKFMDLCEACVVGKLDGWEDSFGVAHEIEAFLGACKPIYFIDPITLEVYEYSEINTRQEQDDRVCRGRAIDL